MTVGLKGFRTIGSKACKLIVSGTLACALTPAIALADVQAYTPAATTIEQVALQAGETCTGPYNDIINNSGIVLATVPTGAKSVKWPDGKWTQTSAEQQQGIYKWSNYIRGDNSHYGHYDVTTTFTVANGQLKAIDLTSFGTSFGGRWGVLTPHDGASFVVGYLPDGVSDASTVNAAQKTITHKLGNVAPYGGTTYDSITVYNAASATELTQVGTLAYSKGGKGKPAGWTSTPDDNFATFNESTGLISVADPNANLVLVKEKIGDYYVFGQYYGLNSSGDKIARALNEKRTDFKTEPSGIGAKDRDVYTAAAYNLIVRKELDSYLAGVDKGGLDAIDTVSAATKSSQSIIEAIYAGADGTFYPWSNDDNPLAGMKVGAYTPIFTSIADNLNVTIDGKALAPDKTSAQKNKSSQYVLTNKLFGDDVAVAGFDFYSKPDGLTDAQSWSLSKGAEKSTALATYLTNNISATGHGIVGAYGVTTKEGTRKDADGNAMSADVLNDAVMSYDPATKAITIKDPKVTHVVVQYAVGKFSDSNGGVCGVTYDLKQLESAQVSQTVTVKNKTVTLSVKDLKKNNKAIKAATVTKGVSAKTKITYSKVKVNKKAKNFTVASNGKITVKKGTPKDTYKVTVKATAKSTTKYRGANKNFTVTVKVK